ncbi:hypothetical protein [Burkholderia gladioli]|nr:hypothetical protein [Burkholderia gladioli]
MKRLINRIWLAAPRLQRRDWHSLVGLLCLYLIAGAIAPAYGI